MPIRRYSEHRGRKLRPDEVVLERFAMSRAGLQFLLHVAPRLDKVVIPRTKGRFSSTGFNKVGLVTTTGAKTGTARVQPLVLIDDGDGLIAIASNYGGAHHPGWAYNLLANPECIVEFRGLPTKHRAELLTGAARATAWRTAVDFYAGYERYRVSASPREIKLFRLRPVD